MTSTSDTPAVHPAILQATDLALKALQEITDLETIGALVGSEAHDETVGTLFFDCLMPGYPGWRWAASLAKVSEANPVTVLEVELLPGDDSLLAPEWVPWAERLAAFREAQAQQAEEEAAEAARAAAELADEDDDEDDVMDNDYSDYDTDLDGIDIDALADAEYDEDDTDEDPVEEDSPDEEE